MKKLVSLAVISVFLLSGTILAQHRFGEGGKFKQLNLSAEQEKQFQDIKYQQQKNAIELRSQIQKNRLEIKHMMSTNNIDEKKLIDLTDANSKIQAQLKAASVKTWLEIYKILTPEQKEIWTKHFGGKNNFKAKFMRGGRGNIDGPRKMRMLNRGERKMGCVNFHDDESIGIVKPEHEQGVEK